MRAAEDRPGLDEEALLLVVRNPVRRFVRRLVAEPALAEDAASETLLAVMERLRAGLRLRRPVSFALQVAWTKALEVRRRASRDLQAEVPERPHVADPASTAELRDWLDSGLAALEPVDRALLHLRYVEDLSYRELGHVLGEPVGTIGRRLHDARVALKDRLERAGRGRTSEATLIALLPRLGGADVGGPPSSLARPTRWIEAATRAATRRRFVASLTLAIAAGASAWKLAGADPAPAAAGVAPATLVADAPRSPAYTSGAAPALLR
ncbi:MAG TPA: sigma-70 family RNA polymerase sigma factor, partial [Planctomycetota bacterium]|nr:sigma-70 family RNA polymerase sigma factor [Planctomycetota bacterium]